MGYTSEMKPEMQPTCMVTRIVIVIATAVRKFVTNGRTFSGKGDYQCNREHRNVQHYTSFMRWEYD